MSTVVESEGFETIRLLTDRNEFVAKVKIPKFNILPDVIMWGIRTFKYAGTIHSPNIYTECFAYAVVTEPLKEGE